MSDSQNLYVKAIRLLACREHARTELRQKLRSDEIDSEDMDGLLDQLEKEGSLSDLRYAEDYINMSLRKGRGPVRIRHELQNKGVDDAIISQMLCRDEGFWLEQLIQVKEKKYGRGQPEDLKQRASWVRFLQSRGFTGQQIRQCL